MIELGLSRVARLFDAGRAQWKAVHVAGTNGKGSVCAYTAALLASAGWKVGRFTSPHLIDRWDCIQIGGKPVDQPKFNAVERLLLQKNKELEIGATEFEILTATAFEVFNDENVDVGVVEVGMGGREDATNILLPQTVLASVITKIALDHQNLLGGTLEQVARHKAGIIKPDVPCIYDGSNFPAVLEVIQSESALVNTNKDITPLLIKVDLGTIKRHHGSSSGALSHLLLDENRPEHVRLAMAMSVEAAKHAGNKLAKCKNVRQEITDEQITESLRSCDWPGRLQMINIEAVSERQQPVLLDGAHNPNAAEALASFVRQNLRGPDKCGITWVYASSAGKDVRQMAERIFSDGDTVVTTQFGPVEGMPWVTPQPAQQLLSQIQQVKAVSPSSRAISEVGRALREASALASGRPMAIVGSLYLVSDVLRLLRDRPISTI